MVRAVFEEAVALTSLALFLGMIAIWAKMNAAPVMYRDAASNAKTTSSA